MGETIDILAFSPHPDDVEIGCSGSLILSAKMGLRVAIVDLTEGEASSCGTPEKRKQEKDIASLLMGVSSRVSLGLPDTQIGIREGDMIRVVEVIREIRPKAVLAPFWKDRHPDHEASGKLLKSACYYSGVPSCGNGKPYRPAQVFHYMIHSPFTPSFIVDISNIWAEKLEVLAAYHSQFSRENQEAHPIAISGKRFAEFLRARAVYFGAMIGVDYGEPFYSSGPVQMSGLFNTEFSGSRDDSRLIYKSF